MCDRLATYCVCVCYALHSSRIVFFRSHSLAHCDAIVFCSFVCDVFSVGWSRMKNVVYEGNNFGRFDATVFGHLQGKILDGFVCLGRCTCIRERRTKNRSLGDEPNLISRKDAASAPQLTNRKNGVVVINDTERIVCERCDAERTNEQDDVS